MRSKGHAIQEIKDLNVLPLEDLLGLLMAHELIMRQHSEEEIKKKKIIALKSVVQEKEESDQTKNDDEDKELVLIIQNFKRFMKKRKGIRRRLLTKGEPNKERDKKQPLICYECKKSDHFKSECPQLKKALKKFKKKKQ